MTSSIDIMQTYPHQIRCFLNLRFLTAVVFVIERKACSTYLHIHLNITQQRGWSLDVR